MKQPAKRLQVKEVHKMLKLDHMRGGVCWTQRRVSHADNDNLRSIYECHQAPSDYLKTLI